MPLQPGRESEREHPVGSSGSWGRITGFCPNQVLYRPLKGIWAGTWIGKVWRDVGLTRADGASVDEPSWSAKAGWAEGPASALNDSMALIAWIVSRN